MEARTRCADQRTFAARKDLDLLGLTDGGHGVLALGDDVRKLVQIQAAQVEGHGAGWQQGGQQQKVQVCSHGSSSVQFCQGHLVVVPPEEWVLAAVACK